MMTLGNELPASSLLHGLERVHGCSFPPGHTTLCRCVAGWRAATRSGVPLLARLFSLTAASDSAYGADESNKSHSSGRHGIVEKLKIGVNGLGKGAQSIPL